MMRNHSQDYALHLRLGETVKVRSESEILETLDSKGTFEGLPFMPEMRKYCGKTFRVLKCADKTCVEGYGMRRIENTVFLEGLRCDGEHHAGCQRACLMFWKEAWLVRMRNGMRQDINVQTDTVNTGTFPTNDPNKTDGIFFCQSTELVNATTPLPWWDIRQYVRDLRSGQLHLFQIVRGLLVLLYNKIQRARGAREFAMLLGERKKTPAECLNLQPGDLVEIKSPLEIQATLNTKGANRGLEFSAEMLKYCGKQYRVLKHINNIILEMTGKMQPIDNTVILDGVICDGSCHRGCPRENLFLWREIWLKRVTAEKSFHSSTTIG
ncbi:MAG: hypothetical protein HY707_07365 [Ignavibacteriae bacterium]|nr:hypothetical protein [Ignavibacteriota bacterium]